jgi:hypothetical protein
MGCDVMVVLGGITSSFYRTWMLKGEATEGGGKGSVRNLDFIYCHDVRLSQGT